jgi:hypothetical protein
MESSDGYKEFKKKGWTDLLMPELRSVGQAMAHIANIELDREAKRRKSVFFKWLDENWEVLQPVIPGLDLTFTPQG